MKAKLRGFAWWRPLAAVGCAAGLLAGLGLAPAPSLGPLAGPVRPVRAPNGEPLRNAQNQVETENWSGYAVAHFETGLTYSGASATWTVPAVTDAPGFANSYSSSWVGIGGFCENASCSKVDKTLIQLGTEQDATASGATTYYAWYEMLPKLPVTIPVTVHPGDVVQAALADGPGSRGAAESPGKGGPAGGHVGGAGQTWVLTFTDETTGQTWSATFSYSSSLLSAEWVEEAPYSGGVLPLADFNVATFDNGTVNSGLNPNLTAGQGIVMLDPNGQTSNPSAPDGDANGFSTCWGSGTTLVACATPSS